MRVIMLILVACAAFAGVASAQPGAPSPEMKSAMEKLAFLTGSWKGDAWVQAGPGPRQDVVQVERVESRLGGLVLSIEGIGTAKEAPDMVLHHALAFVSWDPERSAYRVIAYRQDGRSVDAKGELLEDGSFRWGFEAMGRTMRYTIRNGEGDTWLETGEFSTNGTEWTPFIEMHLSRTP